MSRLFGPIRQNGYVVRDLQKAMRHWTEILGVGPFFYFNHVPISDFYYRGCAGELNIAVALANSGPLQIELIQPKDDAPSLYREFLDAGLAGLQHVGTWTHNMAGEVARLSAMGYAVAQEGRSPVHKNRFVYFDTQGDYPSTVVEIYDITSPSEELFERVRDASIGWDGTNPTRCLD